MSKGLNGRYGISVCLIACLFIGFLKLDAQRVRNYSFDHLTVDDGLSQSSNDFIFQDSQGFVWLSSTDGLNRFDGKDVSVYKSISGDTTSLLGNIITSNFFEDRQKNIWFTTDEGIHCYIRAKDHFRQFQLTTEEAKLLSANYYAFHLEDKKLWVRVGSGNQGKLFLFDISTHTHEVIIHLKGQRNYVVRNELDKIVSARLDTGMLIQTIQKPYQEEFFFKNGTIASVYHVDLAAADTWYLSSNIGMILFHYDERNFEIFNTYRNTPIGEVYYTTSINDSILLVATELQSVLIFNKKSQLFTKKIPFEPEKKRGLHLSRVNTLHKDISNNIWFTSRSSGPNYSNLDKWKFDLPSELRDQHIVTLFESNSGDIFCSHGNGSVFFSKQNNKPIKTSILLPPNERQERISHFLEKEGHIWAFTYSHLLKWNSEEYHYSYVCNLPASLLFPFKSRTNDIWLSTYGKELFELKIERDTVRFEKGSLFNAYNSSYITVIYEDRKKQKYLALDASRLVVLNDKGEEIKEVKGIGYAKAFYEEDNLLWVATTTGILTINTTTLDVNFLNEQNGGLPNEAYYCIIPDEQNNFWLSSNKGIVRYNRNTKTYHRYTLADGLQGNEYNTNAFLKTQDGEIWMGGTNGLNRFYPEQIKSEIPLAKVQFTRLQINDEPAPDSVNITMTEELALACSDNTLSFDFVGIDYSDPENVQLKYQMLGNDEDWIAAGNDGFARYSNLPFGSYTFQIKAANSDGVWSEEIKQLNIHIRRPWYRTWWFYLASVLSISGLIYGIFTYRLQQALKIERMRVKISSDLHDDVGSLLSGLAMQSELLEMTAAEERKPKLQRISELSRNAMSRMRDTVWAIDARKDKLENLLDRIREHAAETLTPNDIRFDLQVEDLALKKNMPTNIRQNLYLICKEAITNAAKHSNGDRVQIQFKKHGRNGIELTIHDNGKVLQKEHKTTGLGMSNMAMRAEEIGGRMEVDVEDGFLIRVEL